MAKKPLPTPDELRQLLDYDPDTGSLRWRPRPLTSFPDERSGKIWNTRFSGKLAAHMRADGYCRAVVNYNGIYVHRIAWAIVYGTWPDGEVDHINGDPSDNRIANLRLVDSSGNSKNSAKRSDNTSGVVGVYKNSARYTLPWSAEIYVNKKKRKLGNFATIEEAAAARREAERDHGYHENHGRH